MMDFVGLALVVVWFGAIALTSASAPRQPGWGYDCLHSFPKPGTWLGQRPHWKPQGCYPRAFDQGATAKCLSNRTVFIVGISTARQVLYSLTEHLGESKTDRQRQKKECSVSTERWVSCERSVSGVTIKYMFLNLMDGFDYSDRGGFSFDLSGNNFAGKNFSNINQALSSAGEDIIFAHDQCNSQPTHLCMRRYLQDATPNDVLIFNLGLMYDLESKVVNNIAWLRAAAAAWIGHISSFPGQVFRVTLSPLHDNWEHRNDRMRALNDVMWGVWRLASSTNSEWSTVDQWSINSRRDHLYNDRIHFSGPLTDASIQMMLNELCPTGGAKVMYTEDLPLDNDLEGQLLHRVFPNGTQDYWIVDKHLTVRPFDQDSPCSKYYKVKGWLNVSPHSLSLLDVDPSPILELCRPNTTVILPNSKKVMMFKDGKMVPVGGRTFRQLGLDFSNIISVQPWLLGLYSLGEALP